MWTVLGTAPDRKGLPYCRCRCACGTERDVQKQNLVSGDSSCCGCVSHTSGGLRHRRQHGHSSEPIYGVWHNMLDRCYNPKSRNYAAYGGRGIYVCEAWHELDNFMGWSSRSGYSTTLTLDRIDVNGNYFPDNCRWVDMLVQGRNRRSNRNITAWNETKPVCAWLEDPRCNVCRTTLMHRMREGDSAEIAMSTGGKSKITAFGETKTISMWECDRRCTVSACALRSRLHAGWDAESAIALPSQQGRRTVESYEARRPVVGS